MQLLAQSILVMAETVLTPSTCIHADKDGDVSRVVVRSHLVTTFKKVKGVSGFNRSIEQKLEV